MRTHCSDTIQTAITSPSFSASSPPHSQTTPAPPTEKKASSIVANSRLDHAAPLQSSNEIRVGGGRAARAVCAPGDEPQELVQRQGSDRPPAALGAPPAREVARLARQLDKTSRDVCMPTHSPCIAGTIRF